jgi:AbiV family abortive infection protein
MNTKSFINISKKECVEICTDICENSEKHWRSGRLLAEKGDYGTAISVSIISIEELIKALILALDSAGFEFRKVKGVNTFFKNHEMRYVIAYFMFVISLLGEELIILVKKHNENPQKTQQIFYDIKKDEISFINRFGFYLKRKIIILRNELRWFSKIDLFRQEGFYCDYNNRFKTPVRISAKEYTEVFERLAKVRRLCRFLIRELKKNDDKEKKQFDEIRKLMKTENYYEKIEYALSSVKCNRKRAFDAIFDHFRSFSEPFSKE